ncbi:Nuclear poly(A) polymerase 2 [Sesamum angolense]|uniref:Nuclear poly(A) polymerase 2 n=1 Tax=Sesamum angolense TaxID=2727404 RepID=A0AAE1XF12_9LAMI|nr:Nuclear poly(A) polymerase 2 [Sesamum angolense]
MGGSDGFNSLPTPSPPPAEQKQPPKQWGVTRPLSHAGPSEVDIQRTRDLEKFLVASGLYESAEEAARREEVLDRLKQIVKDWVKELTRLRGYTDQMVEDANAVIFTFGSYRLGYIILTFGDGVHVTSGDFGYLLRRSSDTKLVSHLSAIYGLLSLATDALQAGNGFLLEHGQSEFRYVYSIERPTVGTLLTGCRVVLSINYLSAWFHRMVYFSLILRCGSASLAYHVHSSVYCVYFALSCYLNVKVSRLRNLRCLKFWLRAWRVVQNVWVADEHGFSYGSSAETPSTDAIFHDIANNPGPPCFYCFFTLGSVFSISPSHNFRHSMIFAIGLTCFGNVMILLRSEVVLPGLGVLQARSDRDGNCSIRVGSLMAGSG